ncbi:type I-E CRISPR-associated protein Cse1/CasA [Pseudoalteromonas galatheae]|uniref:type I-E CRISPR-associated protein Cse1/CasA n=1 Tax=Pseudoalteromonas galatheae TaxID=579562 RepID=UPI0030D138CF
MNFDLLTEKWLPVLTLDKKQEKLGLIELFARAHTLDRIVHDNPLVVSAINRFLIAIATRCVGGVSSDTFKTVFHAGRFDNIVREYLRSPQCNNKFNLFDKTAPFYQTPLLKQDKTTDIRKLSNAYSVGSNKSLFNHSHRKDGFLMDSSEVALRLIEGQCAGLGGGVSGTSSLGKHPNFKQAQLIGATSFYIHAQTLFDFLMLNNPALSDDEVGVPVWERTQEFSLTPRKLDGWCDYLTQQSRAINVIHGNDGRCSEMYYAQGESLEAEKSLLDPYFFYVENVTLKRTVPADFELQLKQGRTSPKMFLLQLMSKKAVHEKLPVGLENLAFIHELGWCSPMLNNLKCNVTGLVNNKANPLDWYEYIVDIPPFLAIDLAQSAV